MRSDRLRLRQVVRNLLSNAGKYGGPHIRLLGDEVDGWYEIRVEDDGEGIPPELEARLFQRFLHRGDMPLVLGSVGLGLSIVRALAEGMGGAVWYERRRGWTCFVVRVPLAVAAEAPKYREAVPGRPPVRPKRRPRRPGPLPRRPPERRPLGRRGAAGPRPAQLTSPLVTRRTIPSRRARACR